MEKEVRSMITIYGRHNGPVTSTYSSWSNMKNRCQNPNASNWSYYGGKGITVCARWQNYTNFLLDMGEKPPGYTLDRIDSAGNYEPENCRWATRLSNARNSSQTLLNVRSVTLIKGLLRSIQPGVARAKAYRLIAPLFSVTFHTICAIDLGINWGDVT